MNLRIDPWLAHAAREATVAFARFAGWLGLGRGPSRPFWGVPRAFVVFLIVFAGGIPLEADGQVVGAIGVSGGSVEQDHEVAEAGVAAF